MRSKNKKRLIIFLVMISVLLTGSSFAYWANYIEGTTESSTSVLQVGSAEGVKTTLSITPNQQNVYGILVPKGQLINSVDPLSVEVITLNHELIWNEAQEVLQTEGNEITGYINADISLEIIPTDSSVTLDQTIYKELYDLINIENNELNPTTLILNDQEPSFLSYNISLVEPANKSQYELLSKSTINIHINYRIRLFDLNIEQPSLSIDFTEIDMEGLSEYNPVSNNIDTWNTELGQPLTHTQYGAESKILLPIDLDEYTISLKAQLTNPNSTSGGYGIHFDTTVTDGYQDSGVIFQFDRGYSWGAMITRERNNSRETSPTWVQYSEDELFPHKYEDPEWWTSEHQIKIEVINITEDTRQATFYIDGILIGSVQYEDVIDDEQVYIGFRGWSSSPTIYYDVEVK